MISYPFTSTGIHVMFKQISIAGLTFLSVLLTSATSSLAELAPEVNSLSIKRIERSNTAPVDNNVQLAADSERSMQYVRQGLAAEKTGDKPQALEYYYQALQIDQTNAVAFLAAGNLLGNTKEGILCVQTAAFLFQQQENTEGYELASNWLKEMGVTRRDY